MKVASTSPSRRVERKERLRGEILAAASKMFADRGYEAVTLREIAKEIGYTHAVIYQHFPDKWHILAELAIADSHETLSEEGMEQGFAAVAEHGDLSKLTLPQIDALEHAIQVALVDDDALLTYCFNIKRNLKNNPAL